MSYHLNVRGLAGLHIGKHVTIKTQHTEASGILQGFTCGAMAINDSGLTGESWVLGPKTATITLLPDQRIIAEIGDEVVVHGNDETDTPQ